ncbi:hypothetical protein MNEG_8528 [Monoraphidium neglectum]|uniref:Uncharacterized protein n=1 Tax=Monoraphidium neglectum TaxID=145388 RepID=A0A0D2MZ54_9CHLO|nr:hypothetical protein MNEG_8528 [Monoraphidium neglectum]KIY99430.1 hypothetical protein MNEG_8528 [Monoraphidium neglectum]|eukprot:XP_013898450.1 hypothetical protein MNEG_8528 [Monoraphidium neglectum]
MCGWADAALQQVKAEKAAAFEASGDKVPPEVEGLGPLADVDAGQLLAAALAELEGRRGEETRRGAEVAEAVGRLADEDEVVTGEALDAWDPLDMSEDELRQLAAKAAGLLGGHISMLDAKKLEQAGVPMSDPEVAALLAAAEATRRQLLAGSGAEGAGL